MHVEDYVDGVVRQPLDDEALLAKVRVLHPGLAYRAVLLPQPIRFRLVSGVDLPLRPFLRLGHAADRGQALKVLHFEELVRDLVGRRQLDLPPIGLIAPNVFVILVGDDLAAFRALGLHLPHILHALGRLAPSLRQVVHLPRARLPERDPSPRLPGHDPDVLDELLLGLVLGRFLVGHLDRALADIGVLLGAKEHRTQQQGMVLHGALFRKEECLRVLPTVDRDQARALLPGGVVEAKTTHPMEQRAGLHILFGRGDLAGEGHQGQILHCLRMLRDASEAPQTAAPVEAVGFARKRADGIWERVCVLLHKLHSALDPLRLLLLPDTIIFPRLLLILHHDAIGPIRVEVGLEVDERRLVIWHAATCELRLVTVENTDLSLHLEPLPRRRRLLHVLVLVFDALWGAAQRPRRGLALQ
mmetsp:Transcript_75478/g.211580  ORF Transcript_75478/g.211580 Transcript_75478/m.211580 type:complete len:415 (-) Transcript_75478:1461-2705(-)